MNGKINYQFYSTQVELIEFAKSVISKYSIFGYCINTSDQDVEINSFNIGKGCSELIVFSREELICASKIHELEKNNPNALFLEIGKKTNNQLRESWLFCLKTIEDSESLSLWGKILRGLKNELQSGAWVCNSKTELREFRKNIRFSKGVLRHYKEGGIVMPAFGNNFHIEIDL